MAPAFARSADFALSKPARTPCPNLAVRVPGEPAPCTIHDALPERGFPGCVTFDCFGAGQRVTAWADWRESPDAAFGAFDVMRALHEVLWYLAEPVPELADERSALADRVAALGPEADVGAVRAEAGGLFERTSVAVRGRRARSLARADLVGKDLRRRGLRDVSLRGALLMGTDLRGVDLGRADLLGTDLRGADLRGALLGSVLFLTNPQVTSAVGDGSTSLPGRVHRPGAWVS
ncbi:pentapeptide repeat-containing protein [Actinomycetospora termitidis]|uniref:Pentapeptide repeat-containing protein n=1 Tax=Actinomycetospora termitidis TaxID=3053470 RepID=A0ABT7M3N8_9PSEU|nr:pentapeptide repeat-containing protein [Actinomycetospora sp. Odt1-22]MDL5155287.1 pentapeptide repeat-containing protein [Actinomycetospora sp. Odt1-22]